MNDDDFVFCVSSETKGLNNEFKNEEEKI